MSKVQKDKTGFQAPPLSIIYKSNIPVACELYYAS